MDFSTFVIAGQSSQLLHRTLKSVERAAADVRKYGLKTEMIVLIDASHPSTRDYAERFQSEIPVRVVRASGEGVFHDIVDCQPTGEFIAVIEGGDLMEREWLAKAHATAVSSPGERLLMHPRVGVVFDGENHCLHFECSDRPGFTHYQLACIFPWTANLCFHRSVLENGTAEVPPGGDTASATAQFLAEQLAVGGIVRTVDQTCVFLRRQKYVPASVRSESPIPPTRLLAPALQSTLGIKRAAPDSVASQNQAPSSAASGDCTATPAKPKKLIAKIKLLPTKVKNEWRRVRKRYLGYRETPNVASPALPPVREIPSWLWHACLGAHSTEPKVFPNEFYLQNARHSQRVDALAWAYERLCQKRTAQPTHVVVLPWLKAGGVDLEALNYVRAIVSQSDEHRVLVVTTENAASSWADRLPEGVDFVEFGRLVSHVAVQDQARLFATWLVQLMPRVIHNMNSHLAYVAFRDFGACLERYSQLYCSVFCEDYAADGRKVGWAFDRLPECCEYLSGVFADNRRILDVLHETFGLRREQLHIHYQPIELADAVTPAQRDRLEVLWAGRLDRQKRIDLLARIAEQLRDEPIRFTVYGSTVLEYDRLDLAWQKYPNIQYRGPFNGFQNLPLDQFDLFLHTAQWEGMPNVLLESLASGLPVMAAGVGGVPELVEDGVTGVCITPFDDVDAYCRQLKQLVRERKRLERLARGGRQRVEQVHSWESFLATLQSVPGYLQPVEETVSKTQVLRRAA